jgi:hypothetical protein
MRFIPLALVGIVAGSCVAVSTSAADHPPDIPLNAAGWASAWDANWASPELLRRGYEPAIGNGERYYCRLDDTPRVGSRLNSRVICIAADSVRPFLGERHGEYYIR